MNVFVPASASFAVLLDERRFSAFLEGVLGAPNIRHLFIVTDSDDAFKEMAAEVSDALKDATVVQLYRDYLENFMINKESRE